MKEIFSWYRMILLMVVILPFVVTQRYAPFIPEAKWELWSESLYPLLSFEQPLSGINDASQVLIIEITPEDERRFGWPMDRTHYVTLLKKLKDSGHPWVLSYLQFFVALATTTTEDAQKNKSLAEAMKSYGKYIGTGLMPLKNGVEALTLDQEETLLPRSVIATNAASLNEIPDGLALAEGEEFLHNQAGFGLGMRFGTEAVIYCAPLYFDADPTDATNPSSLAVPTSLLWAAAHFKQANFETPKGSQSFRSMKNPGFRVGTKHCLSHPGSDTNRFMEQLKLKKYSFSEILDGKVDLSNKLVILGSTQFKKFQGPGADVYTPGSGIVYEHQLAARFLDDLLSERALKREPVASYAPVRHLGALLGLMLFALSFVLGVPVIFMLSGLALFGIILASMVYINALQVYFIPFAIMAQVLLTFLCLGVFWSYLSYYRIRRLTQLRDGLRTSLAKYQDFESYCKGFYEFLAKNFRCLHLELNATHQDLYNAASSPQKVAEYLALRKERLLQGSPTLEPNLVAKPYTHFGLAGKRIRIDASFNVLCGLQGIGSLKLSILFQTWESSLVTEAINAIFAETTEQWARIHRNIESKVSDYESLINATRTKILEKFLAESLINKFSDGRTMEENLKECLTPQEAKAAILQADIRGFSGLFADQKPEAIINLLSGYYSRTVDAAQKVGQVKLIGDCIFLFIEDNPQDARSAADWALHIAAILVRETNHQNELQAQHSGRPPVFFGIAIHFGDVIMGNLSSSNCIDYTVIGANVNRTARMEEMTKKPSIREAIGANGILISKEAEDALRYYQGKIHIQHLDLRAHDVTIRSFTTITQVSYVVASDALEIAEGGLLDKAA